MAERQRPNVDWHVADVQGNCLSVDHANLAVLMDIRRELQALNATFNCQNARNIPVFLAEIRNLLQKKRRVMKRGKR